MKPEGCQCRCRAAYHSLCPAEGLECLLSGHGNCILAVFRLNFRAKPLLLPQSCPIGTLHEKQVIVSCKNGIFFQERKKCECRLSYIQQTVHLSMNWWHSNTLSPHATWYITRIKLVQTGSLCKTGSN